MLVLCIGTAGTSDTANARGNAGKQLMKLVPAVPLCNTKLKYSLTITTCTNSC